MTTARDPADLPRPKAGGEVHAHPHELPAAHDSGGVKPGRCTLVIPTLAQRARAEKLTRAVDSARAQTHPDLEIIVVANGPEVVPGVVEPLRSVARVRVIELAVADHIGARTEGVRAATGEAVCFLDDDDELNPESVASRFQALQSNPGAVGAFTDGVSLRLDGTRLPIVRPDRFDTGDLASSVLSSNWNASCSMLYRRSVFGPEFFADALPFNEWTWYGLKAALRGELIYIPENTYTVHQSVGSLSSRRPFADSAFALLKRTSELPLPRRTRVILRRRLASELHRKACDYAANGERLRAMGLWLRAVAHTPWALRYVPAWRQVLRRGETPRPPHPME